MLDTPDRLRQSRFLSKHLDPYKTLQPNERLFSILQAFNHYQTLTKNGIYALLGGDEKGLNRRLKQLFNADLLYRRTIIGPKRIGETLTFSRTDAGVRYLIRKQKEVVENHNSSAHEEEQVLCDLADLGIHIGSIQSDVEFHGWHDIAAHPNTQLPETAPHRFYVPKHLNIDQKYFTHDGNPFYLKRGSSLCFVKELVRTNKSPIAIKRKVRLYKQLIDDVKDRYGFSHVFVLFITTTPTDRDNILRFIKEEGGSAFILVSMMEDHIALMKPTPIIPTHLFTEPWRRAGFRPFSLTTLDEV